MSKDYKDPSVQGQGQAGQAPAQAGQAPAQAGQAPAQAGQVPAQTGQAPPQIGQVPPQIGQVPVQAGQVPAQTGQVPAQTGQAPPQTGQVPVQTDLPRDTGQIDAEALERKKEKKYRKSLNLMNNIKSMIACDAKIDMYKKAMMAFDNLQGYKDADQYAEECRRLADRAGEEIIMAIYTRAGYYQKTARSASEFKQAAEEFRKVGDYKDAEEMAIKCEQMYADLEKKAAYRKLTHGGLVLLIAAVIVFVIAAPPARYFRAGIYLATGSYGKAATTYKKLGAYKDSAEKMAESRYLRGLEYEAKGSYKKAEKDFEAAGKFKDSGAKRLAMKKLVILNTEAGNDVRAGNCDWVVLDKEDSRVLLMKKTPLTSRPYHNVQEDVTWEKSSLREHLNSDFITNTFSEEERSSILLTDVKNSDNAVYGTDGGNDTMDYAFPLSIEEAIKYKPLFPEFKSNNWLRTPGANKSSAAFLSVDGTVMEYGYIVNSDAISIRPVLWYETK